MLSIKKLIFAGFLAISMAGSASAEVILQDWTMTVTNSDSNFLMDQETLNLSVVYDDEGTYFSNWYLGANRILEYGAGDDMTLAPSETSGDSQVFSDADLYGIDYLWNLLAGYYDGVLSVATDTIFGYSNAQLYSDGFYTTYSFGKQDEYGTFQVYSDTRSGTYTMYYIDDETGQSESTVFEITGFVPDDTSGSDPVAVPAPASAGLLGLSLLAMGWRRSRKHG